MSRNQKRAIPNQELCAAIKSEQFLIGNYEKMIVAVSKCNLLVSTVCRLYES